MFDSHCHLHGERLRKQAPALLQRARAAGVHGFMLAGVEAADWRAAVNVAEAANDCWLSYGIHPQLVPELSELEVKAQFDLLAAAVAARGWPRPAALGEIGLDGRTPERRATLDRQVDLFRAQLALAREHDLPVLLHVLDAHGRALEVLRADGVPRRGGVLHSYSGGPALVKDYLALGLHVSFTGIVTRPNAKKARQALPLVPADRLLVETDSPDQTPLSRLPGPNEPAFLPEIVAVAAALRGEDSTTVGKYTEYNARRLFGIL